MSTETRERNNHSDSKGEKDSSFGNLWNSSGDLLAPGLKNGPSVLNSNAAVRSAYLRKVYGILSVQLALTTVVSGIVMYSTGLQHYIYKNQWILIVNLLASLANTGLLMFMRNSYPINFCLLGSFTLLNSLSLGLIISQYNPVLVTVAFVITTVIVVILTLGTFYHKFNISKIESILGTFLVASFLGSFLHLFLKSPLFDTLLAVFGASVFSAYIVYDTHLIMSKLSAEEYIVGVLNLYLDIINLFIKVLRIIAHFQGKQESNSKDKKKRDD